MKQIRCILVGVGGRGIWTVRETSRHPRFTAVAMVDLNREFLQHAATFNQLEETAWFSQLEHALDQVECDAVIICTPTTTHAPLSRLAFGRGKHVLVEKAMTTDYQEAQAMVDEAAEAGVCLVVAQNYSFMQHNQTVKAILSDASSPYHPGEIGMADIHCYRYRPDPRTMTFPAAMVWDMACHHIDILTSWFGVAPEVLTSKTFNPRWSAYPHDSNIVAHLKIGENLYCNYLLYHSSILNEARMLLQGDRGVVEVDPAREVWFHPKPERQLFASERIKVPLLEGYSVGGTSEVMDAFWHYIADGVEPTISGRANLATLQTCHQLIEASGPKLAAA